MKIVCVGGGPAGLYFAISIKLRNTDHDVIVVERNPYGVTYGWGLVFWNDMLDILYNNDPTSARDIRKSSGHWDDQEIHIRGERAYIRGYGFSIGRKRLLDILLKRAKDLGTDVRFEFEVRICPSSLTPT
jgi:2-polyprenyl-6-methoxyphenol hydroxylase-like FAD-dependent oxidoreductase